MTNNKTEELREALIQPGELFKTTSNKFNAPALIDPTRLQTINIAAQKLLAIAEAYEAGYRLMVINAKPDLLGDILGGGE